MDCNNDKHTLWYLFHTDKLLLKQTEAEKLSLPTEQEVETFKPYFVGTIHSFTAPNACECRTVSMNLPNEMGDEWVWMTLRDAYDYLPFAEYKYGGRAYELLYWDSHSRFCPVCGTPTQHLDTIMKKCPSCAHEVYPPIATATIVLVRRGDEVLLVRARNFRGKHYGLVAGFLEPGETLEECVAREVMEETGLRIRNIQYFGNQPWPYPCGLMVGFTAEYESGDIALQAEELTTAAFFRRDNLPELPRKLSIARRLIDAWIAEQSF